MRRMRQTVLSRGNSSACRSNGRCGDPDLDSETCRDGSGASEGVLRRRWVSGLPFGCDPFLYEGTEMEQCGLPVRFDGWRLLRADVRVETDTKSRISRGNKRGRELRCSCKISGEEFERRGREGQKSWKVTSIGTRTDAGLPSGPSAGFNRQVRTAAMAFSSRPNPRPFAM
jgi:hypothetical protein